MEQEKEIWKDVAEFEGLYQVSNLGNVRSLDRTLLCSKNSVRFFKGVLLKPHVEVKGYLSVRLTNASKSKTVKVHRVVLTAFLPNLENKPFVNHKDCDRKNNKLSNLEWCTAKENEDHKRLYGNWQSVSNHHRAKKVDQFTLDGEFVKTWGSIQEATNYYKIHKSCIQRVCKRKANTAAGFTWKLHKSITKNQSNGQF